MPSFLISSKHDTWLCIKADNARERIRGLLGRDHLPPGTLMLLPRCNLVHTFSMRFHLDIIFIDRNTCIRKIVRDVKPGRFVWGGWATRQTLETQSGWLPDLALGTRLQLTQP